MAKLEWMWVSSTRRRLFDLHRAHADTEWQISNRVHPDVWAVMRGNRKVAEVPSREEAQAFVESTYILETCDDG